MWKPAKYTLWVGCNKRFCRGIWPAREEIPNNPGIWRTGHGTTDWFQIGKGVRQGCILSSCLFNLYAEYIMRNAGLEEAQAGIKIAGRNINNLRYADDRNPYGRKWRRTKEPLDESERGEWKFDLKLNVQKTKIMKSGPITPWQIEGETEKLLFWGLQNHSRWWLQLWN